MHELVKEAYALFGSYEAPRPLDICTDCCMDPKDEERLAQMEVSEIPWDLLRRYNDEASSGHTPAVEVKHFFPRYLEFIAEDNFPSHSEELTLKRFAPFDSAEWTEEELQFLKNFSVTLFKERIDKYPVTDGLTLESILIMFWLGDFDVDMLMELWLNDESWKSTMHFKDFWIDGLHPKQDYRVTNGFADEKLGKKLRIWVDSREVKSVFKRRIEKLVMSDLVLEDLEWAQLDMVYNQLGSTDGV